jgi:DnaJ-class molecular chaperone
MSENKNRQTKPASGSAHKLNPGDEAARGTPGTGEDICPQCHGKGRIGNAVCANCGGRGRIVEGIGGA